MTVIVPFAAGGNTDVMARIFAEQLTKRLGQQFVVENRAGAGGVNGLHAMTRAAPDGYTIAVATSGGIAINPMLIKDKIPYNVEKDFTYLYGMAAQPNIWLVNPSVPANTMAELIAWLKANPETPYATSGPGTTQHICGEMLADAAGLKMTPVSYRASNLSIQDLIGGQIQLACDNFAVAYEQVKGRQAARRLDHVARALSARQRDPADGRDRAGLRTDAGVRLGRPRQHAARHREEAD